MLHRRAVRIGAIDADEGRAMRGSKTHIAVARRILVVVVIALALGLGPLMLQLGVLSSLGLSIALSTGLLTAVFLVAARLPRLRHEARPMHASTARPDAGRGTSPARDPDLAHAEEGAS